MPKQSGAGNGKKESFIFVLALLLLTQVGCTTTTPQFSESTAVDVPALWSFSAGTRETPRG